MYVLGVVPRMPENRKKPEFGTVLHDINIEYFDVLLGFFLVGARVLNFMDHVEALDGPSKNGVLVVEPWLHRVSANAPCGPESSRTTYRLFRSNEELTPVSIGPSIGHTDRVRLVVS